MELILPVPKAISENCLTIQRAIHHLIVNLHESHSSPSDVPFDGNHRNSHVAADLGVAIAQSMGQIDLSGTRAHRVQTGDEPTQALLVIENLIWSRTGSYQRTLSIRTAPALRSYDRAGFCTDLVSFLRRDLPYDPDVAGAFIERNLLALLPE